MSIQDKHSSHTAALAVVVAVAASSSAASFAQQDDKSGLFLRTWGGYSSLADTDGTALGVADPLAPVAVTVNTSGGFTAGAGFGYRYNPTIAVEVAWEYRSNDSETTFASGDRFSDGNYASNTFYLNGYYFLSERGKWEPYVGAGLGWIQEVDIDLEGNGPEQSFSGDGDIGLQVFIGSNYRLTESWSAHGELRYGAFTGVDLAGENVTGAISDFDYRPLTLQFGVSYSF